MSIRQRIITALMAFAMVIGLAVVPATSANATSTYFDNLSGRSVYTKSSAGAYEWLAHGQQGYYVSSWRTPSGCTRITYRDGYARNYTTGGIWVTTRNVSAYLSRC